MNRQISIIVSNFPRLGYYFVALKAAISILFRFHLVLIGRKVGGADVEKLIMDRGNLARDNGEALFRHLVSSGHRNVAFAINRSSVCGNRLKDQGFDEFLIQPLTVKYWLAVSQASIVASSQRDVDVHVRVAKFFFPSTRAKSVYLRHGIQHTSNDAIDLQHEYSLICCSIDDELEHLRYVFRTHGKDLAPLQKLGLARFDRYRTFTKNRSIEALVAPTWRSGKGLMFESRQTSLQPYFREWSEFVQELVNSGVQVSAVKHPMLNHELVEEFRTLGVRILEISDVDLQQEIACSKVLVTDYSSLALDALFARTPVVLFRSQLDNTYTDSHLGHALDFDLFEKRAWHICLSSSCASKHALEELRRTRLSANQEAIRGLLFAGYPKHSCAAIVAAMEALG